MSVQQITDQHFETDVLQSENPVLVAFWASWSLPCLSAMPILDEASKGQYAGKILFFKMNVDDNEVTPMKYNVTGIPTLKLFVQGKDIASKTGHISKIQLASFIDKNI